MRRERERRPTKKKRTIKNDTTRWGQIYNNDDQASGGGGGGYFAQLLETPNASLGPDGTRNNNEIPMKEVERKPDKSPHYLPSDILS